MRRGLTLRRETLAELAAADLRIVAGANEISLPHPRCLSDWVRTCATMQVSCVSCYGSCTC